MTNLGLAPERIGVRPVILVKRLEDHHLVSGIAHRQQGRDHGFGGAAANRDFALRIDRDALPQLHLPGNGVAQVLRSPGNGVLIDVGCDRFLRRTLDLSGCGKIRKALREVDRVVQHGLARHFADDGFREVRNLTAEKRLLLDGGLCHESA